MGELLPQWPNTGRFMVVLNFCRVFLLLLTIGDTWRLLESHMCHGVCLSWSHVSGDVLVYGGQRALAFVRLSQKCFYDFTIIWSKGKKYFSVKRLVLG